MSYSCNKDIVRSRYVKPWEITNKEIIREWAPSSTKDRNKAASNRKALIKVQYAFLARAKGLIN